ncbi:MAG: FAD binding domain-containing protein [Anaerolineales bacterium]|nr:FAD binding domain-containing protein [Anaerolineales bacterium]
MLPNLSDYHRPETPEAALDLLRQAGAAALAGGTSLLATPDDDVRSVVDLQALGWRAIQAQPGRLRLGSLVTLTDLETSPVVMGAAGDLLRQAARHAGPNTHRNVATLGGLVAGRPAVSELLAALLVLGAQVELAGPSASVVPLEDYLSQAPGGLLCALLVPWPGAGSGAAEAIGRTPADAPIVHVAAWVGPGGARLAAGGVGRHVTRLAAVETALALAPGDQATAAAAAAVLEPPADFRGSTEYRRAMISVLVRRVLAAAAGLEA